MSMTRTQVFRRIFKIYNIDLFIHERKFSYHYTKTISEIMTLNKIGMILALNEAYTDFVKNALYPIDSVLLNYIFNLNNPSCLADAELSADMNLLLQHCTSLGYMWSECDIKRKLEHLSTASITLKISEVHENHCMRFFNNLTIQNGIIILRPSKDYIEMLCRYSLINNFITFEELSYSNADNKLEFLEKGTELILSYISSDTSTDK